jgi:hypothetical protein
VLISSILAFHALQESNFRLTSQIISRQIQRVWPEGNAIVAISRLRIPRRATKDEIRVVGIEMAHAVIVAVQDDAVVCYNNIDQGLKIRFVC